MVLIIIQNIYNIVQATHGNLLMPPYIGLIIWFANKNIIYFEWY